MGSSSTTNQSSHQTQNITQTPTNPDWVTSPIQSLAGNLQNLAGADPYSFVAPANALQNQAGDNASKLSGIPWAYDGATDVTRGIANENAPSILGHMDEFMSPYTSMVIKNALRGFDQNAALTNAQTGLDRANDTTFGGSGGAITDALTRGQLAMQRGQLQSGLLNQGYNTALQGATAQAGLDQQTQAQRLAAAGQIAGIANDYQANNRANIGTQGSIGSILQGLQQAQAGAPLTVGSALSGMAATDPFSLFHGQNVNGVTDGTSTSTTTQSNPMQTIGSLAMLAAAPFTGGASLMGGLAGLGGLMGGGGGFNASGGGGSLLGNFAQGGW